MFKEYTTKRGYVFYSVPERKREKELCACNYNAWQRSGLYSLRDAYGRYSAAKERAFNQCRAWCYALDGSGLKIISHNSQVFTCGFEFPDPETGEMHFMYITPTYNRATPIL